MRSVLFVINSLDTLRPHQSTAALIAACARQVPVWVTTTSGFSLSPGAIRVAAWRAGPNAQAAIDQMRATPATELTLGDVGAVWVRTNPGRAAGGSSTWLELLLQAEAGGVRIRNSPTGLVLTASKLHLGTLPAGTVPRTWASDDASRLSVFLDELAGPAVVKPALGTHGSGVVRISPDSPDRTAILERAVRDGPAILQDYLPDAPGGDVRIHVVGGELFEVAGHPCAVLRVPAPGEWRSNVALGGSPQRATLTAAQRALVARVGPVLARQGLWHVGLDVVGDKVVECNVFSPGGLGDASAFSGVDFTGVLVDRFLA
jgi:glutathione synthase